MQSNSPRELWQGTVSSPKGRTGLASSLPGCPRQVFLNLSGLLWRLLKRTNSSDVCDCDSKKPIREGTQALTVN